MLKHLRRRLTILFSILTAAVLAAALTATCRMAQIEAVSGADLVFANTVSAIEDAVTENNLVRDGWLASQEAAGRLVLYMEDNGHPLVFSGGWTPADARTTLVALAREQAVSAGLNPDRLHRQKVNFSLNGAQLSGSYTCTAMLAQINTDTFLVELYERFVPVARDHGHSLTLHLPDNPLPALHADAQRLEQLFAVLLNNAFEYSPAGTPVEILAELPPSGGLHIAVVDHGPGVPDAEKHRIFDRFARGDRSRTDKTHFGLGLAVASQIASLHGAILRVRDTPGGGATFVVEWRNNHVLDRSIFS